MKCTHMRKARQNSRALRFPKHISSKIFAKSKGTGQFTTKSGEKQTGLRLNPLAQGDMDIVNHVPVMADREGPRLLGSRCPILRQSVTILEIEIGFNRVMLQPVIQPPFAVIIEETPL